LPLPSTTPILVSPTPTAGVTFSLPWSCMVRYRVMCPLPQQHLRCRSPSKLPKRGREKIGTCCLEGIQLGGKFHKYTCLARPRCQCGTGNAGQTGLGPQVTQFWKIWDLDVQF
jgi:hypothetical protein